MRYGKVLCSLLLFFSGFQSLQAQQDTPWLRRIGRNEGLAGSLVQSIVQDPHDLYWVANINGLQMYDGRYFRKYPMPFVQNGILGANSIFYLAVESDSILWLAHAQGIAKFNTLDRKFRFIHLPKTSVSQSLNFTSLIVDAAQNVWCGSKELGLLSFDKQTNSFRRESDPAVLALQKIRVKDLDREHLLIMHGAGCSIFSKTTRRLLSAAEVPAKYNWVTLEVAQGNIFDVHLENDHVIIEKWHEKVIELDFFDLDLQTGSVSELNILSAAGRHFFKDSAGNLWIYGDGLDLIRAGSTEVLNVKSNRNEGSSAEFTMATHMIEDRENNVWLSTNDGLYVVNLRESVPVVCNDRDQNGIVKHPYNALIENSDGTFWVGTFGQGLMILDRNKKIIARHDLGKAGNDPRYNLLWTMHATKDKDVWLGCQNGRVVFYEHKTGRFSFMNDSVFRDATLNCIAEDSAGIIYFGTMGGGIVRKKKGGAFESLYVSEPMGNRTAAGAVNTILCRNNELYAATRYDGIVRINLQSGKVEHIRMSISDPNGLKSDNIFCLLEDGNSGFFLGTSSGLGRYEYASGHFSFYTMYDGLPFNTVYDLIKTEGCEMVAGTSDGIYKICWEDKSFRPALRNSSFEKGYNAILLTKDHSELLLGNDEYLYSLRSTPADKGKQPHSYIYNISSADKSFAISGVVQSPVMFDKDHNTIDISFGASSFKYHDAIDYYYMLEGVDKDWVAAGSNRVVTYNKLKGGDYVFRLKCIFQENRSSSQLLELPFSIARPFYETIWFVILMALLVLTLFYLIYRIRLDRLLEIEKIRFSLSRDLHDDMGSTLSTINILSVIASQKIRQEPQLTEDYLKRIAAISQQMMESMDDIIWSINPVNDNMDRVIIRMREFAAGILEPQDIALVFEVDKNVNEIGIQMRWRRDFFLIFKEAINNAAKYSQARTVKIVVGTVSRSLTLSIIDDGKGFSPELAKCGNGITNMRKRAAEINGEISIDSQPGVGTRIMLKVPLNKLQA